MPIGQYSDMKGEFFYDQYKERKEKNKFFQKETDYKGKTYQPSGPGVMV